METTSSHIYLDDTNEVTIKHEASLGELLIATLLTVLIVIKVMKWLHSVFMGGKG